jgi:protein-disulfide isomerase
VAEPRQTKKQRIEEAREQARLAREKRERRQRTMKVLVPTLISVGVLALVGVIIAVIALQPKPAPAFPGGPKNMASDGIVFIQGSGDKAEVAPTAALKKGQKPKATEWSSGDGVAHVTTYIDWSCPACQSFEGQYADSLQKMVAAGTATLEVHPIAILDSRFTGEAKYSTRAANVAACVANYAPEKFFDVQTEFYDNQAEESGPSLTTDKMLSLVHKAGLNNDKVDACIRGKSFEKWVTAATERATSQTALQGANGFATPTVVVNGQKWDNSSDFGTFVQDAAKA